MSFSRRVCRRFGVFVVSFDSFEFEGRRAGDTRFFFYGGRFRDGLLGFVFRRRGFWEVFS